MRTSTEHGGSWPGRKRARGGNLYRAGVLGVLQSGSPRLWAYVACSERTVLWRWLWYTFSQVIFSSNGMIQPTNQRGFTLLELLVVIAIVGILVAVVFVALDPAQRFQQARDAIRQNDVQEILSAVKRYQVDHAGDDLAAVAALTAGNIYMVVDGAMALGCDDQNASCDTAVTGDSHCVDLSLLVDQYLDDVPISPLGSVPWDDGSADGERGTGYTLERDANGTIRVRACESGDAAEISAAL
ncbi:type II secretion system protein [Candidatus Parcubacteria bacterium]|nr:type II secretion system protein [Candidatus Parcubacteria bacterium]